MFSSRFHIKRNERSLARLVKEENNLVFMGKKIKFSGKFSITLRQSHSEMNNLFFRLFSLTFRFNNASFERSKLLLGKRN